MHQPWLDQAPVGAVCAYAGQLEPVDTSPNQLWTSTPCGTPTGMTTEAAGAPPVAKIEVMGWMLCDGRELEVAKYPDLFGALGYLYGGSDGSFAIPDCRGLFLRGVDHGAGMDPDVALRTAAPGGESSGVGSFQCDAFQDHKHSYIPPQSSAASGGKEASAIPGAPMVTDTEGAATNKTAPPGDARVSSETRAKNLYVNYIIKVRSPVHWYPPPFGHR